MQQLSTEKVRLAATAGDLVRAQPRWRRLPAAELTALQVSGYIRTLDKDLAAFADELLAQAREAEAVAAAAQAQRYDLGPPAGVRGLGSCSLPRTELLPQMQGAHMGGAAAYGMPNPHIHAQPHTYNARRGVYPPELGEMHAQPQYQPPQPQYRPPRASDNPGQRCIARRCCERQSLRLTRHASQPPTAQAGCSWRPGGCQHRREWRKLDCYHLHWREPGCAPPAAFSCLRR